MKILIFSDSHGSLAPMLEIVESQRPQEVFHLGDHLEDAQALSHAYPDLPVTMVPGNCDGWTGLPGRLMVERGGVPILLSHGVQYLSGYCVTDPAVTEDIIRRGGKQEIFSGGRKVELNFLMG